MASECVHCNNFKIVLFNLLLGLKLSEANIPEQFFPNTSSILDQLSWNLKILLLKDYFGELGDGKIRLMDTSKDNVELSTLKDHSDGSDPHSRRIGVDRRQEAIPVLEPESADENSMKLKLFRLMYETVRDSDLKAKRAELIRNHYANSTAFEIGYLMGDVTDKFNIMSDIWKTMKRLFNEWKPIEHINAYEQISNHGIEINHLIDLIKSVDKKDANNNSKRMK